tara:strand:+ start:8011 stop:9225 length:1215 start_codon:yes stop_codon:yes gene_type:complete
MGIIDRLFGTKNDNAVTSKDLANLLGSWYDADSGVQITPSNSLQITTVYQCIKVLAESIGMLPLSIFMESENLKSKDLKHPLHRLLKVGPNDYQTAQEWKEMVIAHLCLRGNHYSYINRVSGKVVELLPLAPGSVSLSLNDDYTVQYRITFKNGETKPAEASEILHIKTFSTDGLVGVSPITQNVNSLGLAKATEKHGSSIFKNGAKPFGGLKTNQNLKDEQYDRLVSRLENHQGADNGFRPLILEGGLEWVQVSITPEDAQYLETRKFQRNEICGIYRVPPHMIGDLENATFSNIEHQGLEFVTHTLMPYLTRIENRILFTLLTENEQLNRYVKFNVNALLRGDMAARADFYTKMVQNGALSPNEIRQKEDMNPREGGDVYLTPLNMAVNGKPIEESADANKK